MRIAIVADLVGVVRGGVERHAELLATSLRQEGHAVVLHRPATFRSLDLTAVDLLLVEGVFRRTLLRLRLKRGFDRVRKGLFTHASFYPAVHPGAVGPAESRLADGLAKPLVNRAVLASVFAGFDAVFTLSEAESRDVRAALGRPLPNLHPLPNLLGPRPAPPAGADATEVPANATPYVCAVARIHPRKNFRTFLEAIEGDPLRFLLAGEDGGALAALLAYATEHSVANFRYLGGISETEKQALIRGSIGTVIPSYFEGVPYAALDSLLLGRPVLLTDRSYLEPRPGVFLAPPTVDGLRAGLRELEAAGPVPGRFDYPSDESITRSILSATTSG